MISTFSRVIGVSDAISVVLIDFAKEISIFLGLFAYVKPVIAEFVTITLKWVRKI